MSTPLVADLPAGGRKPASFFSSLASALASLVRRRLVGAECDGLGSAAWVDARTLQVTAPIETLTLTKHSPAELVEQDQALAGSDGLLCPLGPNGFRSSSPLGLGEVNHHAYAYLPSLTQEPAVAGFSSLAA